MPRRNPNPKPTTLLPIFKAATTRANKPIANHLSRWSQCVLCEIGRECLPKHHKSHVLFRGQAPCDVLFIGEAPGPDEAVTGFPFVGRAGKLLDSLLTDTFKRVKFTFAITNTVACFPSNPNGDKLGEPSFRPPTQTEIDNCRPRLREAIEIADPSLVVMLGKVATKNALSLALEYRPESAILHVYHPSYLLRKGGASSIDYKSTVLQLAKFIEGNL